MNIFYIGFIVSEIPRMSVFGNFPCSDTLPNYDLYSKIKIYIYI